jgi:Spy/CpxP family protein refolding chaperone
MNLSRRRTRAASWLGWLLIGAISFGASMALAEGPPPAFMRNFYAPQLVMQNQRAIDLRADQRKAITRAIQKTQTDTIDLQWKMQEAVSELEAAVSKDTIDEKATLAIAERMMEIEGKVKRAHLGLLIQIRNQLDPDQRKRLERIRDGG